MPATTILDQAVMPLWLGVRPHIEARVRQRTGTSPGWVLNLDNLKAGAGLQPKSDGNKTRTMFETKVLPLTADAVAPDGSDVRILLGLAGASMAHFELRAEGVSVAVRHRTVEEIWYVLSGRGEMWRREGGEETTAELTPGVCLTIPLRTEFQFRSRGPEPLRVVGITVPPWPGGGEAIRSDGPWAASVEPGPGLVER